MDGNLTCYIVALVLFFSKRTPILQKERSKKEKVCRTLRTWNQNRISTLLSMDQGQWNSTSLHHGARHQCTWIKCSPISPPISLVLMWTNWIHCIYHLLTQQEWLSCYFKSTIRKQWGKPFLITIFYSCNDSDHIICSMYMKLDSTVQDYQQNWQSLICIWQWWFLGKIYHSFCHHKANRRKYWLVFFYLDQSTSKKNSRMRFTKMSSMHPHRKVDL